MIWCEKGPQNLCVLPRCRLCRFKIEEGEHVIVVTVNGQQTEPFCFSFKHHHHDTQLDRDIYCYSEVTDFSKNDELAIGCHPECLSFATRMVPAVQFKTPSARNTTNYSGITVADSLYKYGIQNVYKSHQPAKYSAIPTFSSLAIDLIKATFAFSRPAEPAEDKGTSISRIFASSIYWYDPPNSEDVRRLAYLRDDLGSKLRDSLDQRARLPREIWLLVADYLLREFAIASLLDAPYRGESNLVASGAIWATFIRIDGRTYVSSLSNDPSTGAILVSQTKEKPPIDNVLYTMEDHVGIRAIRLASKQIPEAGQFDSSTWWRIRPLQPDMNKLRFISDGMKLQYPVIRVDVRDIIHAHLLRSCLWPEPVPITDMARLSHIVTGFQVGIKRMVPVTFNHPECKGYSIAWRQRPNGRFAIVTCHAHMESEGLDFYNDKMRNLTGLLWTFLPLKAGERVEGMWCLRGASHRITLTLTTSLGRCLTSGPPIIRSRKGEGHDWECLAVPPTAGLDRIWFGHANMESDLVASISGPLAYEHELQEPPYDQYIPLQKEVDMSKLLYSEAPLSNVVEIVICRLVDWVPRISGMLFRFRDGLEVAVGDFRLSCAESPIGVSGSPGLSLGFSTLNRNRYVAELATTSSFDAGSLQWQSFPWNGSLVWMFSNTLCFVALGQMGSKSLAQ